MDFAVPSLQKATITAETLRSLKLCTQKQLLKLSVDWDLKWSQCLSHLFVIHSGYNVDVSIAYNSVHRDYSTVAESF